MQKKAQGQRRKFLSPLSHLKQNWGLLNGVGTGQIMHIYRKGKIWLSLAPLGPLGRSGVTSQMNTIHFWGPDDYENCDYQDSSRPTVAEVEYVINAIAASFSLWNYAIEPEEWSRSHALQPVSGRDLKPSYIASFIFL